MWFSCRLKIDTKVVRRSGFGEKNMLNFINILYSDDNSDSERRNVGLCTIPSHCKLTVNMHACVAVEQCPEQFSHIMKNDCLTIDSDRVKIA